MKRSEGRTADQLRTVSLSPGIAPHATGSVVAAFGNTRVICAACIEEGVPRWMKDQGVTGGWITAEYSMLPYSTVGRKARDISKGKQDGRSVEIQRLIGRSLRAAVDLEALGARTLWVDCDVLQADGGTRTASITGACAAMAIAFDKLLRQGKVKKSPLRQMVAAVSTGIVEGSARLDLDYVEDRDASVDFNVVLTEAFEFVEIQGSGEEATFTPDQMAQMIALAQKGAAELFAIQHAVVAAERLALQPVEERGLPIA